MDDNDDEEEVVVVSATIDADNVLSLVVGAGEVAIITTSPFSSTEAGTGGLRLSITVDTAPPIIIRQMYYFLLNVISFWGV